MRGQELDTRADIFSFGVVAYELLAYQKPFQGKQLSALMDEILHRDPTPLRELVPDCPPALEHVVSRCLEKDRQRRYQSFDEVSRDLESVRRELAGEAPGSGKHAPLATPSAAPPAAAAAETGGKADEPSTRPIRSPSTHRRSTAPHPRRWRRAPTSAPSPGPRPPSPRARRRRCWRQTRSHSQRRHRPRPQHLRRQCRRPHPRRG